MTDPLIYLILGQVFYNTFLLNESKWSLITALAWMILGLISLVYSIFNGGKK